MNQTNSATSRTAAAASVLKNLAGVVFWIGLGVELLIMVIEKSSLVNPYEGLLFRVTFCLFSAKVLYLLYAGFFQKKELVVCGVLIVVGVLSWRISGRNQLLRFTMFMLACRGEENRKVLKAFLFSMISGTAVLALLSITGLLGTVTVTANFDGEVSRRFCFGMGNPNSFQIMIGAIVLLAMVLYGSTMNTIWFPLFLVLDILLYVLCRSLMGTGLIGLSVLWVWFLRIQEEKIDTEQTARNILILCRGLIAVFIAGLFFCVAGAIWGYKSSLISWIDYHLLSGRILSLWGFTFNDGTLSTWTWFGSRLNNRFFDLGWIRVVYWYGVIPALLILWMTFRLEHCMERHRDWTGCMAIITISLFTLMEAHFVSEYIGRNYLLVMMTPYLPAIFGIESIEESKL